MEFVCFVSSVVNNYQSKAEQAWEFSENLQNDVVQPLRSLARAQSKDLLELDDSEGELNLSLKQREITVRRYQQNY